MHTFVAQTVIRIDVSVDVSVLVSFVVSAILNVLVSFRFVSLRFD